MSEKENHNNDKQLMLKYQKGDSMAFETLYLRHKDKVYSYLAYRIFDENQLEDTFQKVFLKFHKSRHLYQEKYELLPWLYTITKSVLLDVLKKKKVKYVKFDEEYHQHLDNKEGVELFDIESQKKLSKKEKMVLKFRYEDDKEFKEIAKVLDTSSSNIRKILSRAIKKLRQSKGQL